MCNLTASQKDMSVLWIIVCVLCCFSLTKCQTFCTIQNTKDWFTAFKTCKMLSGRLPAVNISNNQLQLQDFYVTSNISSPFWIGATYDFLDINVTEPSYGYTYPYTCCDEIQNFGGKHQVICSSCSRYNGVVCANSTSNIFIIERNFLWKEAFFECQKRNLSLPTRDNAQFLEKVTAQVGAFWLDGIKQINFKPDNGIQNRNCLYSKIGIIHEGNCFNNSTATVCIFGNTTPGSEQTCIPSVNTAIPSKTGSLQTTGAVIGGVVGSVVVAIVITIVIVILVRKNRSRMDNNCQKERCVREHIRENPGITNSYFGVGRNASFEKVDRKTTNETETSTDFHTQSQNYTKKEQRSSNHDKTAENTYERVASVLYTVVQKELKSNKAENCGEQVKGSEDNDEEYDKSPYCSKLNQAASSGNDYDKANFKHHANFEYDTTYDTKFKHSDNSEYDSTNDINLKHSDNSEYDTTNDINLKHADNSEYDITKDINISIDDTYDHV
ncbi:hypothetical protein CHS0354_036498 [Potamilus streckersoni]|uniref:C-type lectin domain-containing protein n=1 Tax=Potamilus streckersoni TaxID=2493646 RepID=A0AAE0S3K1_9BIVA|nr:hypothetical protein CHS0354_036498 [Potamilus streckersoni]